MLPLLANKDECIVCSTPLTTIRYRCSHA